MKKAKELNKEKKNTAKKHKKEKKELKVEAKETNLNSNIKAYKKETKNLMTKYRT